MMTPGDYIYFNELCELVDGGKCCHQTVLVCDLACDDGHVEIAAAKHALSLNINVIYCFFI